MNILVTGGLGIVGTGLVKELRHRGHRVVSCDLYHQPDEVGFSLRAATSRRRAAARDDGRRFRWRRQTGPNLEVVRRVANRAEIR